MIDYSIRKIPGDDLDPAPRGQRGRAEAKGGGWGDPNDFEDRWTARCRYFKIIKESASHAHQQLMALMASNEPPLGLLRKMKFELIGRHLIEDRDLNLVEQINQTWTFAVALAAARELLQPFPKQMDFV